MHASERHQAILRRVAERGSMRVADIATELGVSPVTVRKDVGTLADRGQLRRVHGGAVLAEGTTEKPAVTIGMIVPSAGYYYPDVIAGAREAAAAQGARLVLHISEYDPDEERAQARQLVEDGIDGLLTAPSLEDGRPWYEDLDIPVVLIERRPAEDTAPTEHVVTDHEYGARLAVRHLVDRGRRHIALVVRGSTPTAPWIVRGYSSGLQTARLKSPIEQVDLESRPSGSRPYDKAIDTVVAAVKAGKVDAALVHTDYDALALLRRLRSRGIGVPDDVAIVSYDDEVAALAEIPLSAVAPSKREVGRCAVELLTQRLANPDRPRRRIFILPDLHIRASS
jgi:DNA-binding LacI/PurR family transcriptional regulator